MSWLLFVFALVALALAINVVRPHYDHPKYMVFSFLFGWLAGELALHLVAAQAVLLFLVIWFGELEGFLDGLSVLLIASSWVLLLYHYFSGFRAFSVLDALSPEQASKVLSWRRLLRPLYHYRDHGLIVDKNIVYREVDGIRLKLDIRRQHTQLKRAPVVMHIHGGAWTKGYGSKNEQGLPMMQALAKAGWVCVSVDYRLSPQATFPEHIIDCKHALAWIREHIEDFGGNPEFVVVTGGSAGGHLSSLLALSDKEPAFCEGLEDANLSVQGCVPFYGIYDLLDEQRLQPNVGLEIVMRKSIIKQTKLENPELYRSMSPVTHINENAPPFMIVHGDKDSLTSYAEAEYFAGRLAEVSKQTVKFVGIHGAQHAFEIFPSLRCDIVIAGVVAEMENWHARYQQTQNTKD